MAEAGPGHNGIALRVPGPKQAAEEAIGPADFFQIGRCKAPVRRIQEDGPVIPLLGQAGPAADHLLDQGVLAADGHRQHQLFHRFRVAQGQVLGDHAPLGNAHHAGPLDAQQAHGKVYVLPHVRRGKANGQGGPPADHVHGIGRTGHAPIHDRQGQGGSLNGFQAVPQAGDHHQGFRPVAEADIIHGDIPGPKGRVFCVVQHAVLLAAAWISPLRHSHCNLGQAGPQGAVCLPEHSKGPGTKGPGPKGRRSLSGRRRRYGDRGRYGGRPPGRRWRPSPPGPGQSRKYPGFRRCGWG